MMTLIKSNLSSPNLHRFFDDFITRDLTNKKSKTYSPFDTKFPPVNILENDDHFLIEMAVPGMSKKDFSIELDQETLTISAKKKESSNQKNDKLPIYKYREFNYKTFSRSFRLSKEVVSFDNIEARYKNGLLQLLISKREEAKKVPARQISIS